MRQEMVELQNYLLDYFCEWMNNEKINNNNLHNPDCTFGTRIMGQDQLQEGKWFLGDNNYINVSLSNIKGGIGVTSIRLFFVMGKNGDLTRIQLDMSNNPEDLEDKLEKILIKKADEFGLSYKCKNSFYVINLNQISRKYTLDSYSLRESLNRMTKYVIPFIYKFLRENNYGNLMIDINEARERLNLIEPHRPGTLKQAGF